MRKVIFAVLYLRFSPRPDAQETQSIEAQRAICHEYCRRKGYQIIGEHVDRECSGDDEDRPGLWEAVAQMRRGRVLVVSHPDRLARSVYLEECLYRESEKRGCPIEAAEGGTNGDKPEDELIRRILSFFREYQKKVSALRTKAHMLEHQKAGWAMSKHPPYGWREGEPDGQKRRWVADEAEQRVIRRVTELARQGFTSGQIVKRLRATGTKCRGKTWHRQTVRRIIARG